MSDVTGSIGNQAVELKNAATEATLKLLLQNMSTSNRQIADAISNMATKAGLDPTKVAGVNKGLTSLTQAGQESGGVLGGLGTSAQGGASWLKKMSFSVGVVDGGLQRLGGVLGNLAQIAGSGSMNISEFGAALKGLPLVGWFLGLAGELSKLKEAEFKTYQNISQSGIQMGGSLTGLRHAAMGSMMTLDQLGGVLRKNSETFTRMGANADEGAKRFTQMSARLVSLNDGALMKLGLTGEQAANGLASYIEMTGGLSKSEQKDSTKTVEATGRYLEQLDALADLTGKSKEEMEKQLKEQSKNAAWQAKLATMTPEQKEKAIAGMAKALALGGKGAADAFQSKVMGVPPITKEAKQFTAVMGETNKSVIGMANGVNDSSQTLSDQNRQYAQGQQATIKDMGKMSEQQKFAMIQQNGALASTIQAGQETANKSKDKTLEELNLDSIAADKKRQLAGSEAARAAEAQKAWVAVQQALYDALTGLMGDPQGILMEAAQIALGMIQWLTKWKSEIITLVKVIAGGAAVMTVFWAFMKAKTAIEAAQSSKASGGGLLKQFSAATGVGAGALGSNPNNPMWVKVVGGGALGGGGAGGRGGAGGGGAGGGGGPGIGSKLAEGLGGLGKGLQGLLSGLGKGAGELIRSILTGLGDGLGALGKPQVMLGAVTLGLLAAVLWGASKALQNFATISWEDMGKGFTTLLGLGALGAALSFASPFIVAGATAIGAMGLALIPFAVAMALVSVSMPTFTAGLTAMSTINGDGLGKVALGAGALGGALIAWAPFAVFGSVAASALTQMADSFAKLSTVDPVKLEKVAAAMQKVKDATPGIGQAVGGAISGFANKLIGTSEPAPAAAAAKSTPAATDTSNPANVTVTELRSLNKQITEVLKFIKETADNTKQTVSATKALDGNRFKR